MVDLQDVMASLEPADQARIDQVHRHAPQQTKRKLLSGASSTSSHRLRSTSTIPKPFDEAACHVPACTLLNCCTAHNQPNAVQMGKELAQQRQQLKVLKSPLRTLYYFAACAASAAVRGVAWGLQHPVFYFLLLPVLSAYAGLKYTGPGTNSALAPKGSVTLSQSVS